MKVLLILTLAVVAFANPDRLAQIDQINAEQDSWVAGPNQFTFMSDEEIQDYLGLIVAPPSENKKVNLEAELLSEFLTLPAEFDSRDQWKNCIHPIRNQARCGSCWAFSASEVLSDRTCIEGGDNVVLSPQQMVSCDKHDMGCQGGYLQHAWSYMDGTGIVTEDCYPYTSGTGNRGYCKSHCVSAQHTWKPYKAVGYNEFTTIDEIKQEVYTNGPIQTGFLVYQDFMQYKGGVYVHNKRFSKLLGGHAVKIVGWGHDDKTNSDYWTVANSWTKNWGENGFFRIKMGQTQLQFERQGIAGKADV